MKLSKREITLFAVLGVVLGSIVYYKYIIIPQTAIASSVSVDRKQKRNELERFKTDIASKHKLKVELIKLQKKLNNNSEDYFLTLDQEEIILLLNDFAKDTDVKVEAITFEEPREEILGENEDGDESTESSDSKQVKEKDKQEDNQNKKNKDKTDESKATVKDEIEEDAGDNLDVYTVNLEYESSYASLLDLLKLITNHDKRIMIKDINIKKEETENQNIKGNITLDFYVIGRILGEEHELYAWGINPLKTLEDPFTQFNGYHIVKEEENDASQEESKSSTEEPSSTENSPSENVENKSESPNTSSASSGLNQMTSSNISNNTSYTVNSGLTINQANISDSSSGPSNNKPLEPQKTNVPSKPPKPVKPSNPANSGGNNQGVNNDKSKIETKEIFNFEDMKLLSFKSEKNDENIKGEISLNKDNKIQGKSSLSVKYNFLENRNNNLAKVSFENGLKIIDKPKYISLFVNPIEKNNCVLGVIIKDGIGEEHKLTLTKNLDWSGWKTLLVELPESIKDPIVESLYIESINDNEKVAGNLLMDGLKLIYVNK